MSTEFPKKQANITQIQLRTIDRETALAFVFSHHYSKIMPRLTDVYLGGFLNETLVGVITLGWGVRPVHTIQKLFPSLGRHDYYEIGKMCMHEEMPKNSESVFLSRTIKWIKANRPEKVALFTWADGILGKPGYVYQGANFQYGGFIWTDLYVSDKGEKIHPRTSQGITQRNEGLTCGHRPTKLQLKEWKWKHYRGKQFRYIYFLCSKKRRKQLLQESTVVWNLNYPKQQDLKWKVQDLDTGKWEASPAFNYNPETDYSSNRTVRKNMKKVRQYQKAKEFFTLP